HFPPLSQVSVGSPRRIRWRTEWDDSYDFRNTKNPALARRTALRMRKWLRFHDEGNRDHFAFDMGARGCPVVFDQHDWYDGGTGENGHRLGRSLLAFYREWSKVC